MRVIIKVGRSCNNDCTFCHASDRRHGDDPRPRIEAKIRDAHALGADMVVLSGGEPTLRKDLLALADAVRAEDMSLGLITNGRRLSDPDLTRALLDRGLAYAYVSLHGATAPTHDNVVRAKAFEQSLAAIRLLHGAVPELTVNAVATLDNLHDLRGIVDLLRPLHALCLKFTMPQPKGAALHDFDRVVPTLLEASTAVADAIRYGRSDAHVPASRYGHEGFPLCLLPGLEHLRNDLETHGFTHMSEPDDDGLVPIDKVLLTKTARCQGCALLDECPGIYKQYASRRGDLELRPRSPQAEDAAKARREVMAREQAAHEQRHWVRLTYACNNRCQFCLDRETGRSDARKADVVREEVVEGRRRGADRLILSGGEATTHPRFADFVRLGKRAGYRWVQTVTNGRMLSYPKFLNAAIAAGLDEVTVSMHGDTAALHDELVGVPGAFEQAAKGIVAALASRRLVVNIDIVINGLNVAHLPRMLETFVGWGVREFDLLHIIPFGSAWHPDHRHLFYDLSAYADTIRDALAFSQREGVHLWLNRFPPEHAEGFEFLIQDPYKLLDEVRGRAEGFSEFVRGGPHLPCRSRERCDRCYLQALCDGFVNVRDLAKSPRVAHLRVQAPLEDGRTLPPADVVHIDAANIEEAEQAVGRVHAQRLILQLERADGLAARIAPHGTFAGVAVQAVVAHSSSALTEAIACPATIDVIVALNVETAPALRALAAHAARLVLEQPTYAKLSEALERDVDLRELFSGLGFSCRTRGIAPCLTGAAGELPAGALRASVLDPLGIVDPLLYAGRFTVDEFFTKSLRCRTCPCGAECEGMHINWVRAHGYAQLDPRRCPGGG